jgi:predicted  nucleic acid-binding Zn-ribbon protein
MSDLKDIGLTISQLQSLGKKQPLKGVELERAKELMIILKKAGYTNKQIRDLSGEAWSENTIKLYTRGTNVEDSISKENAERIIADMISKGIDLDQIKLAVLLKDNLEPKGLRTEDILCFIDEAKKYNINLKDLFQTYNAFKEISLSIANLIESTQYMIQLKGLGFTVDNIQQFLKVSKKFGSVSNVIEAINAFSTLNFIRQEIKDIELQKQQAKEQLDSLRTEVKTLEDKSNKIQDILKSYDELKQKGLDNDIILQIRKAAVKYGGFKKCLEALNVHENLDSIKSQMDDLEKKKSNVESGLNKANADYAHFQSLLDLLNTLLYDLRFSIPAIEDIYQVAKKYGKPLETIKALSKYSELKSLENDVDDLMKRKTELESKINVLEIRTRELEGQATAIKESVSGLLKPISSEIGQVLTTTIERISLTFQQQIDMIKQQSEEYGKRLGQSTAFKEELNLARLIGAVIRYPTEAAKDLPIDHAILLINAVSNFCKAKMINTKVKPGEALSKKYPFLSFQQEVEALDLLDWSKRALEVSL